MSFLDRILAILAPHECLGCSAEGSLLCAGCAARSLPPLPERCYRCQLPSPGWAVCVACRPVSGLQTVRSFAAYDGLAKELIKRLKFSGAQAAASIMAAHLSTLMEVSPGTLIVPVPTATSRARRRGYDQASLLARELSRQTRLSSLDCLARSGQTHQVGSSRQQRTHQLSGAFRLRAPQKNLKGMNIILIDDVVTTGATLEAATRALRPAGPARIEAVTFCAA